MTFKTVAVVVLVAALVSPAFGQSQPYVNVHDKFKVGATFAGAPLIDVPEPVQPGQYAPYGRYDIDVQPGPDGSIALPPPSTAPCPTGVFPWGTPIKCAYSTFDWPRNAASAYVRWWEITNGQKWTAGHYTNDDLNPARSKFYAVPENADCRAPYAHLCHPPVIVFPPWLLQMMGGSGLFFFGR